MRVVHVVPAVSHEASGPSYAVPSLCAALHARGVDVSLHVTAQGPIPPLPFQVTAHPYWPHTFPLLISPTMKRCLRGVAKGADIMHNHSLWALPNVYPGVAVRGTRCRLVTSPRGTLSPWALARRRLVKRAMWFAFQGRAVRESALIHATSPKELAEIRRAGLTAPVAVVPNGVEIPAEPAPARQQGERRRLLFVSRVHPVKGIETLLAAWRMAAPRAPDWDLSIVGPGSDDYVAQLKALAASLRCERVTFDGPAYGDQKRAAFRAADLFVLPSRSENFGVVVAEALSHGVPAVVSKAAPWHGLVDNDCGFWVDEGVEPLADCLRAAVEMPLPRLREMGLRGRAWISRDYSWTRVGEMMHATYEWLLGGGAPPHWVEVDAR